MIDEEETIKTIGDQVLDILFDFRKNYEAAGQGDAKYLIYRILRRITINGFCRIWGDKETTKRGQVFRGWLWDMAQTEVLIRAKQEKKALQQKIKEYESL